MPSAYAQSSGSDQPAASDAEQPAKPAKKAVKPKPKPEATSDASSDAKASDKPKDDKPKAAKGPVTVSVENKRSVALKSLTALATGGKGDPKQVIGAVKPGKKGVGHIARTKDCTYDLHGVYDDGSVFDATEVDLCKAGPFNLVD